MLTTSTRKLLVVNMTFTGRSAPYQKEAPAFGWDVGNDSSQLVDVAFQVYHSKFSWEARELKQVAVFLEAVWESQKGGDPKGNGKDPLSAN